MLALKASVIFKPDGDDELPRSGQLISAEFDLALPVLEQHLILLNKRAVVGYATALGVETTLFRVRKQLTEAAYARHFGRRLVTRSGKKLMLTFAETRIFLGIKTAGELPADILKGA